MVVVAVVLAAAGTTAKATEINAFISTAVKAATDELLPSFERANGYSIRASYAPSGALVPKFERGEPVDIFVTDSTAIDKLIAAGKIAGGRTDIARTGIGICVRKGDARPDVATPETFKRAMQAAKSVAYASPAGGSITGPHIQSVFARLGIAEQMAPKTRFAAGGPDGRVSVLVASGQAEIGLQQVSELMSNPNVEVIGLLPADLQQITTYAAAITTGAIEAEAARGMIKALTAPNAAPVYKARGLEPL